MLKTKWIGPEEEVWEQAKVCSKPHEEGCDYEKKFFFVTLGYSYYTLEELKYELMLVPYIIRDACHTHTGTELKP
jgi:hypothetical protein